MNIVSHLARVSVYVFTETASFLEGKECGLAITQDSTAGFNINFIQDLNSSGIKLLFQKLIIDTFLARFPSISSDFLGGPLILRQRKINMKAFTRQAMYSLFIKFCNVGTKLLNSPTVKHLWSQPLFHRYVFYVGIV